MAELMSMQKLYDAALKKNITKEELDFMLPMLIQLQKDKDIGNAKKITKAKGGNISNQMEMFEEGGLKDDGGTVDPISGNDVPPGSTQEEVRDDIPAQLSEGEFVFPADVVRYIGLQNLMQMRQQAKMGLKEMEDMGQMGNSEEATMPDDMPFDINDIDMQDEEEYNSNTEENMEMAKGGVVYAATGFGGTVTNAPGLTMKKSSFDNTAARNPTPEYKAPPIPAAAPSGGFKYGTGNKTETTTSYDKLVGGVGADEYRTYVNDAGAEIQVPFKSGQMLTGYVLPEGYRPKSVDKVETAKTQSTRIKTARVDNESENSDDASKGGASISFGGTPDPSKPGLQQNAITANISYNVNALGGILGIAGGMSKVADINKGLAVETKGNQYGKVTNPVELQFGKGKSIAVTSKVYSTIKSSVYGKTAKEMKDRMEVLNNIATQSFTFDEDKNLYTDSGGRTISQEQAEQAGIDINNHIDSEISKGRSMKSIVNSLNNTEVSMAQDVSIEAEDDQQSYSTTTAPTSLSNMTPNNDDEDNNDSSNASDSGGVDASNPDSSDMGYGFKQGGLAGKKKTPKPKKMKQGGLASRK